MLKFFRKLTTKQWLSIFLVWAIGSIPMTYALTAITTQTPLSYVSEVSRLAIRSGVGNFATWGISTPVINTGKQLAGAVTNNQELKDQAASWFNAGKASEIADIAQEKGSQVKLPSVPLPDLPSVAVGTKTKEAPVATTAKGQNIPKLSWSYQKYPNYVVDLGPAVVDYSITKGNTYYSPLDKLGRTQRTVAAVTYSMMQATEGKERPAFTSSADPSGWTGNKKESIDLGGGKTYNGYFWNRSHQLAYSLGGDMERHNLITGTRTQNVGKNDGKGGMAYTEEIVRDYLRDHKQCVVYYSVTPVYSGNELIPRYSVVDVKSCTGDLDMRVGVFNSAKGYTIDYTTGTYRKEK